MNLRIIAAIPAFLILAACSTVSMRIPMPTGEPAPDQSRLILFQRDTQTIRSEYKVILDGQRTCGIAFGEVLAWDLPPGEHEISFRNPGMPQSAILSFRAEPGRTTYVSSEANTALGSFGLVGAMIVAKAENNRAVSAWVILEEVSEEMGKAAMTSLAAPAGCPYAGRQPPSAPQTRTEVKGPS